MRKHSEQTITQQIGGDGVIVMDAEGGIVGANPGGHEYLTLMSKAERDGTLNHLDLRPLDALLTALREGDLNQEIVIEEPCLYVFEVFALPMRTAFQLNGWALTVRDVTGTPQEATNSQPSGSGRLRSVFHWPPSSSLTSNIR